MRALLEILQTMAHERVGNYVSPGLSSRLIGGRTWGTVRLFSADRDTREWVTPHSHRFDFACLVLRGAVENLLYQEVKSDHLLANTFSKAVLRPKAEGLGGYTVTRSNSPSFYLEVGQFYREGDVYSMTSEEIHSIRFSKGAEVLLLEGPSVRGTSVILEPFVDGKTIETFKVEPWMFERPMLSNGGTGEGR